MISAFLARYGLGWVLGPVGKGLAIAAAVLFAMHLIRQDALADCKADQLAAQLKVEQERRAEAERIANEAREAADASAARIETLEGLTNELIDDAGTECPVSDDIRERLRAIEAGS